MNIQDIFSGKVSIDSVQTLDSLTTAREDTLMERTKREEEFRRQYEENEKYNLTTVTSQPDVNGLILYRPTRGMVSDHFNAEKKHFGTDIAANPNESVLATMDGTRSRTVEPATMNLAFFCRWNTLPTGWNAMWKLLPRSFTASKRPVNELPL
jgi:hypothetical protein